MPKTKRTWQMWVEVPVTVQAFDAASAEKKAMRTFSANAVLNADVVVLPDAVFYEATAPEVPVPVG